MHISNILDFKWKCNNALQSFTCCKNCKKEPVHTCVLSHPGVTDRVSLWARNPHATQRFGGSVLQAIVYMGSRYSQVPEHYLNYNCDHQMINLRMQVIMLKEAKIWLPEQIYVAILRLLISHSFLLYNDSHMLWIFIVCFNKREANSSFPSNTDACVSLKPLGLDFLARPSPLSFTHLKCFCLHLPCCSHP